jgi:NAD(P)H dehydrogenase (quinone)
MTKYLITSGNSKVGKATIHALKALGEANIVVGARDPVKSEVELKKVGASSVVELDFNKPETVAKAMEGVDRVLIVHGPPPSVPDFVKWSTTVADAAKHPGSTVKVLGKIAGFFSDSQSNIAIAKTHGQVFDILKNTGLQYFAIGPMFFFENWLQQKNSIHSGAVNGASNGAKVGYIAVDDIAAAAAVALKNPGKYTGRHLPIVAQFVTEQEILKEITDATGIPATYNDLSSDAYHALLKQYGLPDDVVDLLTILEKLKASGGALASAPNDLLKEIIGREPLTAHAWVRANAAAFK